MTQAHITYTTTQTTPELYKTELHKMAALQHAERLIYIVEDDKANNFLCKTTLQEVGFNNIIPFYRADTALEDLKNKDANEKAFPALILLDINMPAMDGWGFLNEYRKFSTQSKQHTSILLFSTSNHPTDIAKAKGYPEVTGFLEKPITEEAANWLKEKNIGVSA